jgi:hypothetical protein
MFSLAAATLVSERLKLPADPLDTLPEDSVAVVSVSGSEPLRA